MGEVEKLSDRRAATPRTPAPASASSRRKGNGGDGEKGEKRPPLWRWFGTQIAHSDPAKAAAAKHVRERWDLPTSRFSKIDRALTQEDSVHLTPFRMLLDEYRIAYNVETGDEDYARETGVAGLLVPFGPEKCEKCNRDAVPGTGMCGMHGGQWISPQDYADISHRIHDRLLTMSESALRVLQDLMDNGRSEQVRMMAATAVLDRAGVGPHMNVNHTGEITISDSEKAATELRARLDRMAENNRQHQAMIEAAQAEADGTMEEPLEAEVVEG